MTNSGTTGPSKGVIQPYLQIYSHSFEAFARHRATRDDTTLVSLPLFHVSGISLCYALWSVGGRVVLRSKFSASQFLDIARETGVTMGPMVTAQAEFLMAMPPKPDDADNPIRVVSTTGMRDPAAFMERFGIEDLYFPYSMTEISTPISSYCPGKVPKGCGKPRSGVEVRLVDEDDIPVPAGEVGELIVRSHLPWEMNLGYWRCPEETVRAWRNGWFHTGDLFRCDGEGEFYFVDRKKDALRRRGENISSFEVEREVLKHPDVSEAVCVGVPSDVGEDELKVFIVPCTGSLLDPADLIRFLIPNMANFMVPRFVEIVEELPKTPTMRVKKFELRARGNSADTWDREKAGVKINR